MMLYQEGVKLGLNITETDRYLKEAMSREGGIRDESSAGETLNSSGQSTITADKKGDGRLTVEDLLESGMIEEYLKKGGDITGEAWVEFYKKIRQSFSIDSISEIKKIAEQKGIKHENNAWKQEVFARSKSSFEMVFVKGGTFQMGKAPGVRDAQPVHSVTLSDFFISKYPVTQGLWERVMSHNPSYFKGDDNLPVEQISWYEAVEFCNRFSETEGLLKVYTIEKDYDDICNKNESDRLKWRVRADFSANGYRLPTEAEWEYAARGGSLSKGYTYSGSNNAGDVALYLENSGSKPHPVGQKLPNELGIYDMSGNVWEWCWDWYGSYSSDARTNPKGPLYGSYRVYRGGSWKDPMSYVLPSVRGDSNPSFEFDFLGLRIVKKR
ncbi:MAG: formylglycine-generating enzyme family protein [Ignavibacteriaceae bacterium]|nr:formylglycine-generating enzyme family protein [Ignavibacteriaceae bacterium]